MVPISKDYLEKLCVQELVHLIKTQNGSFENEIQRLDDDSELVSCTEAEQMEWQFFPNFSSSSIFDSKIIISHHIDFGHVEVYEESVSRSCPFDMVNNRFLIINKPNLGNLKPIKRCLKFKKIEEITIF
ncbi:hypothetical protein BpHYR1_010139 [Brachionus plicatilis]|uniref:Uncharacterized protein n=1 Tax=Brachionus plicatilis TaxID=10195 RepID=A0A3M7R9N5_BRAPC|nr:hypothetical protein BpHYR1_010139 [Brachionus plicatilis]